MNSTQFNSDLEDLNSSLKALRLILFPPSHSDFWGQETFLGMKRSVLSEGRVPLICQMGLELNVNFISLGKLIQKKKE